MPSQDVQDAYFSPVWEDLRKMLERRDDAVKSMVAEGVAKRDLDAHVHAEDINDASKIARVTVPAGIAPHVRTVVDENVFHVFLEHEMSHFGIMYHRCSR